MVPCFVATSFFFVFAATTALAADCVAVLPAIPMLMKSTLRFCALMVYCLPRPILGADMSNAMNGFFPSTNDAPIRSPAMSMSGQQSAAKSFGDWLQK
ncbi:Uncharacterised protein [uncultured archaeon]|nr:Uncharacterised protein [uncultured archaeon]